MTISDKYFFIQHEICFEVRNIDISLFYNPLYFEKLSIILILCFNLLKITYTKKVLENKIKVLENKKKF